MTPKTTTPIATHIQKISICNSKTSLLISVTPLVILRANQSAFIGTEKIKSAEMILFCKFCKYLKDIFYPFSVLNKNKTYLYTIIRYIYN
jgi:hypothetical protein